MVVFDGIHNYRIQQIMVRLSGGGGILCRHAHNLIDDVLFSVY